jgi:hypothetical protein
VLDYFVSFDVIASTTSCSSSSSSSSSKKTQPSTWPLQFLKEWMILGLHHLSITEWDLILIRFGLIFRECECCLPRVPSPSFSKETRISHVSAILWFGWIWRLLFPILSPPLYSFHTLLFQVLQCTKSRQFGHGSSSSHVCRIYRPCLLFGSRRV